LFKNTATYIVKINTESDDHQKMSTHKALITGITGFVGPYLARQLIDSGNEVAGLVLRRADGRKPKSLIEMGIISEVQLITGDIVDLTSILSAIQETEPDWIFHLAAQSFIPESFKDPLSTFRMNCLGTQNLLEAVRLKDLDSKVIFAGTSEEYGLQFKDANHFERVKKKYGVIEPPPRIFPELPIDEEGYLRPMSPYATSKVYGDYAFRNYHNTFNLNTIVSRSFNHEGAGRGPHFVTSTIVRQLVQMYLEKEGIMRIGDVQSFRDWSHVEDIVNGYMLLAEKAAAGSVYVQGSMRTNSVLSYILCTITMLGHEIHQVRTIKGEKKIKDPLSRSKINIGKTTLNSNIVDEMLIAGTLEYNLTDEGLIIETDKRTFRIEFDPSKFRPSDVPILLSNTEKVKRLGFTTTKEIVDIVKDQINYYLDPAHRVDHISQ
jgi:GDPmannose 4,6-dehydratase